MEISKDTGTCKSVNFWNPEWLKYSVINTAIAVIGFVGLTVGNILLHVANYTACAATSLLIGKILILAGSITIVMLVMKLIYERVKMNLSHYARNTCI